MVSGTVEYEITDVGSGANPRHWWEKKLDFNI